MVEGKWLPPGADIGPALALRQEIFRLGRDSHDDFAWQALALVEGKPVGAGRIWWQEGDFHIGAIGVLQENRGHGFGDFLTRLLLYKAQTHSARQVLLHTLPDTAAFFERYGFLPCGERDTDGSIPYTLSWRDMMLDGCKGH